MSKTSKILVIQTNSDGRPCGWGTISSDAPNALALAEAEAEMQWLKHNCYPGERKGPVLRHEFTDDPGRVS